MCVAVTIKWHVSISGLYSILVPSTSVVNPFLFLLSESNGREGKSWLICVCVCVCVCVREREREIPFVIWSICCPPTFPLVAIESPRPLDVCTTVVWFAGTSKIFVLLLSTTPNAPFSPESVLVHFFFHGTKLSMKVWHVLKIVSCVSGHR